MSALAKGTRKCATAEAGGWSLQKSCHLFPFPFNENPEIAVKVTQRLNRVVSCGVRGGFLAAEMNASFGTIPSFDATLESEVTFKNFSKVCFALGCPVADTRGVGNAYGWRLYTSRRRLGF